MFHIFLTVFQVMRKEKVLSIAGRQDGNLFLLEQDGFHRY